MGANAGTKILASQYNGWWTTLNQIRTNWNKGTVTPITVSAGTSATASDINSLINQVNALRNLYSGGDWANFTESTKSVGQLIEYPSKMEYMLNYLKTVCAHNSTTGFFSTTSDNGTTGFFSTTSNNGTTSVNGTTSANSTTGVFGTEAGGYSVTFFSSQFCNNNGT